MNSAQHLWSWLSGKKTYLVAVAACIYAWGVAHNLWPNDPLLDTVLVSGGAAALRHGWKTEAAKILAAAVSDTPVLPPLRGIDAAAPAGAKSGQINLGMLLALCGVGAVCWIPLLMIGCAHLAPGADPFVVRIEQAQSSAKPGFDFVLGTENENRSFWQTNTPGFYDFCEWLRQPQAVTGPTAFGTNIDMALPRASAMQWNLDQVKQAYKAGRATSNEVFTVLSTLQGAVTQAGSWASVLTNGPASR